MPSRPQGTQLGDLLLCHHRRRAAQLADMRWMIAAVLLMASVVAGCVGSTPSLPVDDRYPVRWFPTPAGSGEVLAATEAGPLAERLQGSWLVTFTLESATDAALSPGPAVARWSYVVTPECSKGPCDIKVKIYRQPGGGLAATRRFVYRDLGYLRYDTQDDQPCTTPDGQTIPKGATYKTTTRFALIEKAQAGTAVTVLRIDGARTLDAQPNERGAAAGCMPGSARWLIGGLEGAYRTADSRPAATPRPTPAPTRRPTSGSSGGSSGSSGSGWTEAAYRTAVAYQDSAYQTYRIDVARSVDALSWMDCTGMTGEECYAIGMEGATWVRLAKDAINRHLAFMKGHPAATCFRDAYAADKKVASKLLDVLSSWHAGNSGELRYWNQVIGFAYSAASKFVDDLSGYFKDCR